MKIVHAGILRAVVLPVAIGAVLSLLQQARLFEFWGVNPNLSLAGFAVFAALAPGFVNYAFLFLSAAFFIQPVSARASAAFAGIGLLLYVLRVVAPWRAFARCLFSVIAGTFLFYALADFQFLIIAPISVALELGYNLSLAAVFYAMARAYYRALFGPYEAPE